MDTANGFTVVVVDDDEAQRGALSEALEREGFSVVSMSRAAEAEPLLNGERTRMLFIVDGQIPGERPDELCRRLAADRIPYLRITGDERSIAEDCRGRDVRGRAIGVVKKPLSLRMLILTVRLALGLGTATDRPVAVEPETASNGC